MIVEERTYRIASGKLPEYLTLYEREGLPLQTAILGGLVGFFVTDIGPLGSVVHLWSYGSYAEREERRAALAENPDWQAYLEKASPYFAKQESRILVPTSFSPLR